MRADFDITTRDLDHVADLVGLRAGMTSRHLAVKQARSTTSSSFSSLSPQEQATLIGGVLGAGGGLLSNLTREEEDRRPLRDAVVGGLLGGAAGLAGRSLYDNWPAIQAALGQAGPAPDVTRYDGPTNPRGGGILTRPATVEDRIGRLVNAVTGGGSAQRLARNDQPGSIQDTAQEYFDNGPAAAASHALTSGFVANPLVPLTSGAAGYLGGRGLDTLSNRLTALRDVRLHDANFAKQLAAWELAARQRLPERVNNWLASASPQDLKNITSNPEAIARMRAGVSAFGKATSPVWTPASLFPGVQPATVTAPVTAPTQAYRRRPPSRPTAQISAEVAGMLGPLGRARLGRAIAVTPPRPSLAPPKDLLNNAEFNRLLAQVESHAAKSPVVPSYGAKPVKAPFEHVPGVPLQPGQYRTPNSRKWRWAGGLTGLLGGTGANMLMDSYNTDVAARTDAALNGQ